MAMGLLRSIFSSEIRLHFASVEVLLNKRLVAELGVPRGYRSALTLDLKRISQSTSADIKKCLETIEYSKSLLHLRNIQAENNQSISAQNTIQNLRTDLTQINNYDLGDLRTIIDRANIFLAELDQKNAQHNLSKKEIEDYAVLQRAIPQMQDAQELLTASIQEIAKTLRDFAKQYPEHSSIALMDIKHIK